jgi:hypothetical protein
MHALDVVLFTGRYRARALQQNGFRTRSSPQVDQHWRPVLHHLDAGEMPRDLRIY